ncbi:hypothetical protein BaRGS_00007003 [Batillaria attramentaria]|uniref:Uncharacterized protein n=1 Tax=Batillaria attramentaria TaxID=370345 RepID=A0ABD0LQ38_9CAEN
MQSRCGRGINWVTEPFLHHQTNEYRNQEQNSEQTYLLANERIKHQLYAARSYKAKNGRSRLPIPFDGVLTLTSTVDGLPITEDIQIRCGPIIRTQDTIALVTFA